MRRLADNRGCELRDLENRRFLESLVRLAHCCGHCTRKSHQTRLFAPRLLASPSPLPGNRSTYRCRQTIISDRKLRFHIVAQTLTSHLVVSTGRTCTTCCLNFINSFSLKCSAYDIKYDKTSSDKI